MRKKYTYDVVVQVGLTPIIAWRFRSLDNVAKFLNEVNFDIAHAYVHRFPDCKSIDVDSLLNIYYGD